MAAVLRWELLCHQDRSWSWRRVGPGDAIELTSERIPTFGKAISDAIAHGFKPKVDNWVIDHGNWSTYYGPAGEPVAIASNDTVLRRPDAQDHGQSQNGIGQADKTPV